MNMQNEEQLNKLFNLAKEQEVLLSSKEIEGLIIGRQGMTSADNHQKFKSKKITAMSISTLILTIAGTLTIFIHNHPKSMVKTSGHHLQIVVKPYKNLTIANENGEPILPDRNSITESSVLTILLDDTAKKKTIDQSKKMKDDENINTNKKQDISHKVDINSNETKKIVDKKLSIDEKETKEGPHTQFIVPPGFEKETFVHLNKEDLKKLGLYIKNGIYMYEMEDTREGNIKAFWGGKGGMLSRCKSGKKVINGNNPIIAFISTSNGRFRDGVGYIYEIEEARTEAPRLLPIWLEDPSKENETIYIAWFGINDKLIELLPLNVQQNLKVNKDFYKHVLPEQVVEKEFDVANFYKLPLPKYGIDSITIPSIGSGSIAVDENQIFIANTLLLKKLGFKSLTPIKFHKRKKGADLKFKIEDISMYLSSSGSDKFGDGKSLKTIYPYFISRYYPTNHSVSDFTCIINSGIGSKINVSQLFENKKYEMLGFKMKSGNFDYVFWYEPTEALLKELPEIDRKKIEDYIVANKDILKNIDVNINLPKEKSFEEIANEEILIEPSFAKETFVNLTKDELKKLGIYIKDDVFMYEMNETRLGNFKAFFGDKSFISMTSHSKIENPKGNNPLAMFATTVDGEIKDLLGLFFNPSKMEAYKISSSMLPVWVEDETSKAGKPYIAWFEINDTLNDLLPERIQKNLNSNKSFYSHTLSDNNKKKEKVKLSQKNIAIDKNQIIIPDTIFLKKLGFTSFNPIIYYRRNTEGELAINSNRYGTNMSTGTGNWNLVKDSINTIFPSFISSNDTIAGQINDLSEFNMSMDYSQFQSFNNKKFGMLGLLLKGIDANKIFWYDVNDAILNELKAEDKIRIKNYSEANKDNLKGIYLNTKFPKEKSFEEVVNGKTTNSAAIKTVTLNPVQLKKLAINVENKKVIHKIYLGKNKDTGKPSALQIAYDKSGSISTYPLNFDNYDSASYTYPVMLTDDLGQYARSTLNAGKSYELDKISSYNLIPVLVKSGEEYTTMDQLTKKARPDIIFWYEPTEKFLKILDTNIANEIRKDIAALTCSRTKITFTVDSACDGKSTLSCNYFEACQNTKSKAIKKYSVFPNPAKDNFNLKLDLKEECSVLVYMFSLNGAEVKQFPIGKMKPGISQKELSSNGIIPGLYLLRISTDKGDVFNERILIKE